ncbi:exodeoxyribonuclease VII large subunit [Hutsoniella sourekii]
MSWGKEVTSLSELAPENYLTISQLSTYLKRKFDLDPYLRKVFVVGEVSNFRKRPNGHQYFSLKDEHSRMSVVMFKSAFNRLPFELEEGMKVLATGSVTLYEPSGNYQMVLESLEPEGLGALYQAMEQLKAKLKTEGLLDRPRRPLPAYPKRIAVVTSPTGAVIRDILTTIRRRYPIVQVTVFPTLVQGKQAAGQIASAFRLIEERSADFDLVIVARGGGSIEDLWPFNEEEVARAIVACSLPVISSIGHETDTTIADLVADLRAPTPTAAAELAVPVLQEVLLNLYKYQERLVLAIRSQVNQAKERFSRSQQSYVLQEPQRLYQAYIQQLDLANQRLEQAQDRYLNQQQQSLAQLKHRLTLQVPTRRIQAGQEAVQLAQRQLHQAKNHYFQAQSDHLAKQAGLLEALSPLKILARGYAVVQEGDQLVRSIDQLRVGQTIDIQVRDGQATAQVQALQAGQLSSTNRNEEIE